MSTYKDIKRGYAEWKRDYDGCKDVATWKAGYQGKAYEYTQRKEKSGERIMTERAVVAFQAFALSPIPARNYSNLWLLSIVSTETSMSKRATRMTYVFLVRTVRSIPFGVGPLVTSAIKPASFAHAFALRIFINLARRLAGAGMLVLVAKLGYNGSKVRSNSRLRLRSRREDWRLLHLILSIHDGQ